MKKEEVASAKEETSSNNKVKEVEKTDKKRDTPPTKKSEDDNASDKNEKSDTPTESTIGKKTEEGVSDKKDGGSEEAGENDKNRRVYVGNLAWEVSWQDLKDLMKSTGNVTRADIMQTPDGRSKGCGIVEFATAEGAKQAVLTLNDTELMGRQIFVREDREDRSGPSGGGRHRFSSGSNAQSRRVYVGNLSWDIAWPELKDHMRQSGEVVHAEVICEHNGRSKGCGIVEYATEEAVKAAIETLTHTDLKGRTIFVREDREISSSGTTGGHGSSSSDAGGRSQNTSVYVWNLSYDTSWQELKDHMRKAGNVDQATLLTDPEGKSIGCGIVVYQRPHEAARAIRELQDSDLKGRPMHLREDRVQSGRGHHHHHHGGRGFGGRGRRDQQQQQQHHGGEEGSQLFVSNLSFDTTWRELKDHFKQCGDVERADVKFSDGKSRGFGTVRFYKAEDAEAAMKTLNGVELQRRNLEVRLDNKA